VLEEIRQQIVETYRMDKRPWVVGFSGGKDSTALLQIVFETLLELPESERVKPLHVVSNDTLVEIPQVAQMVASSLEKIEGAAIRHRLPISVKQTTPEIEETFFVNLIGRGYPSPNTRFRWCTERMKIDPTSRYIKEVINQQGEVIILLGARKSESATRAQVMENHRLEGTVLRRHSRMPKCFVYTPIENLSTDDVWEYLLTVDSPWGNDNHGLFKLYKEAEGGECPLVIDTTTPSCGNSRFGCWVCTVVEQDRAVEGFIESGSENLRPLLRFRGFLKEARSRREWRERVRKNGQLVNQAGEEVWGPFTLDARREILRQLLLVEKESGLRLVSMEELLLIQRLWQQGGRSIQGPTADLQYSVARILVEVRGGSEMGTYLELLEAGVDPILESVCNERGLKAELIQRLKAEEEAVAHLQRRDRVFHKIDEILDSAEAAR
jgi:DNA sulfur modification protein DndC